MEEEEEEEMGGALTFLYTTEKPDAFLLINRGNKVCIDVAASPTPRKLRGMQINFFISR